MEVSDISLSDHFLLSFLVDCKTLKSYYKTITYRNMRQVNKEEFKNELSYTIKSISVVENLGKVVTEFNVKTAKLMDKHASKVTRKVKIVDSARWFDTECKESRRERRRAEKRYKHTGNLVDKDTFVRIRKGTNDLARSKKQQLFTSWVKDAKNKPKALFKVVNKMTDVKQESCLPSADSDTQLANRFSVL